MNVSQPPGTDTVPGVVAASGQAPGRDGSVLTTIADAVVSLMETMGGPGAAIAIALENLFPPIPSEVILPLAGFTASQGDLSLVGAILWTILGSVTGALLLYAIGAWLGIRRLRAVAVRLPLVRGSDIDATEAWFARHGTKAVFFGRMLPIFRSLISIPAGIERMALPVFVGLTAAGSAIWNTVLILAGYLLGEQWHVVEQYIAILQWVVIAGAVALVAWFLWRRLGPGRPPAQD